MYIYLYNMCMYTHTHTHARTDVLFEVIWSIISRIDYIYI